MNNAKYCQLIFVTETNDETESEKTKIKTHKSAKNFFISFY